MYIIEMHSLKHAYAKVILEKEDTQKIYEQFVKHRLIINHTGDVDPKTCKWCAITRKAELLRERRKV